jgi:hypothetical protein
MAFDVTPEVLMRAKALEKRRRGLEGAKGKDISDRKLNLPWASRLVWG